MFLMAPRRPYPIHVVDGWGCNFYANVNLDLFRRDCYYAFMDVAPSQVLTISQLSNLTCYFGDELLSSCRLLAKLDIPSREVDYSYYTLLLQRLIQLSYGVRGLGMLLRSCNNAPLDSLLDEVLH